MKNYIYTLLGYWIWLGKYNIFLQEDFSSVEELGFNDIDGHIFVGINDNGIKHILKGKIIFKLNAKTK